MVGLLDRAKDDWRELNLWVRIALIPLILVGLAIVLGALFFGLSLLAGFFYGFSVGLSQRSPREIVGVLLVLGFIIAIVVGLVSEIRARS